MLLAVSVCGWLPGITGLSLSIRQPPHLPPEQNGRRPLLGEIRCSDLPRGSSTIRAVMMKRSSKRNGDSVLPGLTEVDDRDRRSTLLRVKNARFLREKFLEDSNYDQT